MKIIHQNARKKLRGGSALRALALIGATATMAAVSAAPAAAQDYTRGNLEGTVVDASGAPVVGANVTVRSNSQGFTNTTTTDESGSFLVSGLSTGGYTVVVEQNGATLVRDPAASVTAGRASNYRYTAASPGEATASAGGDEIVVTGTRQRVDDFSQTQIGANLDVAELAQTIPVSRDQTSLILLAPGTTGGDTGFGDLASIGGSTVAENAYYVNGLNITDFRNFIGGSRVPFEFYRTLDVKTGGYLAEYGRAMGGVTSAVTKAGGNDLEGGAVLVYNPEFGYSKSPDTILARNELDYRESVEANFYLSGPIIKDRLFFYALYSPQYSKQKDASFSSEQQITDTASSPFFGGKIDAVITDGHRLEFTYFRDREVTRRDYAGFNTETDEIGPRIGRTIFEAGGDNFIGTYTGQITDWLTVSAAYGENRNTGSSTPSPNLSLVTSRINPPEDLNIRTVSGFTGGTTADEDLRKIYRADIDVYANFLGEHHFRAGFDLEELSAEERTLRTGSGYDYEIYAPNTAFPDGRILRTRYENVGTFTSEQRAFYIQDSWTLFDRLNLQLGVRNDRFANSTVNGEEYYNSGDQWAPRVGASFDVFGDQRTRLKAYFGRYYLPVATNTNIRLGGQELFYRQFFNMPAGVSGAVDANGDGIPDGLTFDDNGAPALGSVIDYGLICPDVGPDAGQPCVQVNSDGVLGPTDTLVSANLAPSYTDEFIIGASHRIGDFTFGINYINRRLGETLEDVAIDAGVNAYCEANGIAGCEDVFTGYHQYTLANPGSDIVVRLDGDCSIEGQCDVVTLLADDLGYQKAERLYDSVQFTIDKDFNGTYGFNGSYTYTHLRGNYEGAVKSDINQTDAGLTQDFDQPGFQDGFFGELANSREHVFKFYGYVKPLEWLSVSANVLVESPRRFSCIGNYFDQNDFAAGYGVASFYCVQPDVGGTPVTNSGNDGINGVNPATGVNDDGTSYLVPRSSAFQGEWNSQIDLGFAVDLSALNSSFGSTQFRVDVFNVLNSKGALDFDEFGDAGDFLYEPSETYGQPIGYQTPRSVRFTLAMRFGGAQ